MRQFIILAILLWANNAFCQNYRDVPTDNYIKDYYDRYGVKVSIPCDAQASIDNVAWKNNVEFKKTLGGLFSLMVTRTDKQCIIMFPLVVDKLIQTNINSSVNGYMGYIHREILQSYNVLDENLRMRNNYSSCYDPGSHLTSITGDEVRSSNNVDKICYYSLACKEGMFRNARGQTLTFVPEEYSHIIRLFFLKEGGYHFDALLLMTDEAYHNRAKYISDLTGMITFDEERIKDVWEHTEASSK